MATHAFNPSMQKAEARWILSECEASLNYGESSRPETLSQKTKNNNNKKTRCQPLVSTSVYTQNEFKTYNIL